MGEKLAAWFFVIVMVLGILGGLSTNAGWLVLSVQLLLIGLVVAICPIWVLSLTLHQRRERQAERAAERARQLKVDTATAEAWLGIDVPIEGQCPICQSPLVVGASYCTHCRGAVGEATGTQGLPLLLCPSCWERQPAGSTYCWHCGEDLSQRVEVGTVESTTTTNR
jgi:hypothetical protein